MLLVLGITLGCGSTEQPAKATSASTPGATLVPVVLPDISSASESARAQIRERYAALMRTIESRDALPESRAAAYGDMGKLFIAAELFDAAEASLTNARTLAPGDMRWPYFLAHVSRFRNEPAKAAFLFEQALTIQPNHVPSLVRLAEMHLALNQPEAAKPLLVRAQAIDPENGAALYGLGRVALEAKDYAQAVTYLEGALAASPSATRVQYPLAMAYRGLGDRQKAEAHLRLRGEVDLTPADPLMGELGGLLQNAAAYETRGAQAIDAREWSDAVTNLRKAADLAPDNAGTRLNLATSLYMRGDVNGALEQYRVAIRLSPGLAKAHFGMGVLLETRGQDLEAIETFTAAIRNDPGYVEARFSLANALRRNGRVRESLPHYAEVLRANPNVSQASFAYAMGLVRLGRYQDARDRLEQATTAFPDQPGFAHALARLLAAAPDDPVRDGSRALTLMRELLKTQRTLGLMETMAMALAEIGRFDEAADWQRQAIALAGETAPTGVVARLTENRRLYERGQPCRTPWTADDPVHHPTPSAQ
jgi:tetratricopeptide (TPR) repeat protein